MPLDDLRFDPPSDDQEHPEWFDQDDCMAFPGEDHLGWHLEDGTHGIAVVDLNPQFVDSVLQEANMPGAQVRLSTSRGVIQATGQIRRGLVEMVIGAYIIAARKAALAALEEAKEDSDD